MSVFTDLVRSDRDSVFLNLQEFALEMIHLPSGEKIRVVVDPTKATIDDKFGWAAVVEGRMYVPAEVEISLRDRWLPLGPQEQLDLLGLKHTDEFITEGYDAEPGGVKAVRVKRRTDIETARMPEM